MRADGVVVMPPTFDNDLGFPQRVEDFTVEQFVTQATSLTPIWRIASAMPWPCETRTSTCRSFVTISSGLCLFLGISVLLDAKNCPPSALMRQIRGIEEGSVSGSS
jgi:hypothetical protein